MAKVYQFNCCLCAFHAAQIHTGIDTLITAVFPHNASNPGNEILLVQFFISGCIVLSKTLRPVPKDTTKTHSGHSQTWPWSKRTQSAVYVLPKGTSTLEATEQTDAVSEELFRNRHFLSAFWKASLLFWLTGKEICNYMYKIWGSKSGFKPGVT